MQMSCRLLFLDTEFTDFIDCELISIGLVSEDGQHQFYAERSDFDVRKCNQWVLGNIIPLLSLQPQQRMSRATLHEALRSWFESLPSPVIVAFDYATDWDLLLDALLDYGKEDLPRTIAGADNIAHILGDASVAKAMETYFAEHQPRHHALVDAFGLREGWLTWKRISP